MTRSSAYAAVFAAYCATAPAQALDCDDSHIGEQACAVVRGCAIALGDEGALRFEGRALGVDKGAFEVLTEYERHCWGEFEWLEAKPTSGVAKGACAATITIPEEAFFFSLEQRGDGSITGSAILNAGLVRVYVRIGSVDTNAPPEWPAECRATIAS